MRHIQMVPIERVTILNPRARNKLQHKEIIDNIAAIGLKRPITVSSNMADEHGPTYSLVCGQGRLEAYRALGLTQIPAHVIDANENDCMVMSLVENVARRQRPAIESLREIQRLHKSGYSEPQIADKIGTSASWVSMVVVLLERGEDRLVAAVETGLLPMSLAVEISRSDDVAIQQLLSDAYTEGTLRGRKLRTLRRLLEIRARRGKSTFHRTTERRDVSRKLSVEQLKRIYQKEVERQQLLIKKADIAQTRLIFVLRALRTLREDKRFVAILRSEGIETLPKALSDRMDLGG